ncbi:glycosyltransferase [bacterium]|nr:glycosyltransferase [bacterium]
MSESSMRVLFVLPAYTPFVGGAQTLARAMAQRLVADGVHVTILTTTAQQADDFWRPPHSTQERLPLRDEIDGVQVVRLPIGYPWPAPYAFGVLRRLGHRLQRVRLPLGLQKCLLSQMSRFVPPLGALQSTVNRLVADSDLVHVIDATWDGLFTTAGSAALAAKRPLVATPLVHTGSPAISAHFTMPHQQDIYRRADAVLALTAVEKRWLLAQGADAERIHVLPMGVDAGVGTAHVAIEPAAVEAFRRRYDLGEPLVAFVGAATYDKGAFTLVQAVNELLHRDRPVWLACVGPQQAQVDELIASLPAAGGERLRQRVRLLGVVDETTKQTLLASSTVLALPSRVDSFGIVLLEAWQQGLPVVAAQAGGLVDIVQPGENGLLVPFGDVPALADGLAQLLDDPAWARQMGEAGRQSVQRNYSWDQTYDTLFQLFKSLRRTGETAQVRSTAADGPRRERRNRHG